MEIEASYAFVLGITRLLMFVQLEFDFWKKLWSQISSMINLFEYARANRLITSRPEWKSSSILILQFIKSRRWATKRCEGDDKSILNPAPTAINGSRRKSKKKNKEKLSPGRQRKKSNLKISRVLAVCSWTIEECEKWLFGYFRFFSPTRKCHENISLGSYGKLLRWS